MVVLLVQRFGAGLVIERWQGRRFDSRRRSTRLSQPSIPPG